MHGRELVSDVMRRCVVSDSDRVVWANRCVEFAREIGLVVRVGAVGEDGPLLPHVRVEAGGLVVDPQRALPGDILHDAGHLAIMPSCFRRLAEGHLTKAFKAMSGYLESHWEGLSGYPEDPLCRACIQASEPEAIAWQYAAAVHLGLPHELLFPDYPSDEDWVHVLVGLEIGQHLGINGLQAAGWTSRRPRDGAAAAVYPALSRWLQA